MPVEIVNNPCQIERLQQRVRNAARHTRAALDALSTDPMEALYMIRFNEFGHHPLEDRPLNLIEQLNQTSTIMASLAAARHLLERFPNCGGLRLNPGARRGRDIESISLNEEGFHLVEAEVFAAVDPANNDKLNKDIARLAGSKAECRFVFFYCPGISPGLQCPQAAADTGIEVWALGRDDVM